MRYSPQLRLAVNFQLYEFTRSGRAERLGIVNDDLPAEILVSMAALSSAVLQTWRHELGKLLGRDVSIKLTSGYRSPMLNQATPGADTHSQHVKGEAADTHPLGVDQAAAMELLKALAAAGLPVDQAIAYSAARGGQIHVSHTLRRAPRRMFLYRPAQGPSERWRDPR